MVTLVRTAPPANTVFVAFAAYGALWGPYLAMLPEVRQATGASEGQLGTALLAGALAAMPAMYGVGRLLDRFGRPVAVLALALFALIAALPALADSVPELILVVALFGFGSGACNVVVVALAATLEVGSGRRVMNGAHALFSIGVLVCSICTGVVRSYGIPGHAISVVLALTLAPAALAARGRIPSRLVRQRVNPGGRRHLGRPALLLCLLAALAAVIESGVQQWSAVFLADVVRAPVGLSATAPGFFAAGMTFGRLSGQWLSSRAADRTVLLSSGGLSGVGVILLSIAESPAHGLLGTAVVGAAISVATPTAFGIIGRGAAPEGRGAVIGSIASLASVGGLLGPAMVGQLAGHVDLRTAMAALSIVSLAIALLSLSVPGRSLAEPMTSGGRAAG